MHVTRITHDPAVVGGRPCIRGLRITVAMLLNLLAVASSHERILQAYPWLEPDDIKETLAHASAELPYVVDHAVIFLHKLARTAERHAFTMPALAMG